MKKFAMLLILAVCFIFTSCSDAITIDNIDTYETPYTYSRVFAGKIRECKEDGIINDAKDFTNKFFTIVLNRAHRDNTTLGHETIMFSQEFLKDKKEILEEDILKVKEFYKEYGLSTELINLEYEKVVNCKGDAYIVCLARIRLLECNDEKVAKIMGFEEGVGSDALCKYSLKLKYINRGYMVYDCDIVEEEGYMHHINKYPEIISNTLTKQEKLERFAFVVSKAQNDRDYRTFSGDEDYKYLSKAYRKELNKYRDDVKYTKEVYIKHKMVTKLESCEVTGITETEGGYILGVTLRIKMQECISSDVAKKVGFSKGVGSIGEKKYEYYVIEEKGEFKINGMSYLR